MKTLRLLLAILVMSFGFGSCSDSAGPKELGPLTDSSILFTGFTMNTTPFNKLYAVLPDGSGFRMLTTGPEESIHPRWSRDGEKIAYVVNRNSSKEVWVMRKDQTDTHAVATGVGCATTLVLLSWSPTGDRIVGDCRGNNQFVINVADNTYYSLTQRWGRLVEAPDWSPVGDKLLYVRYPNAYVANLDGSGETLVLSSAKDVAWSPDGTRIAFARFLDASYGRSAIFLANADGSGVRQLTFPPASSSDTNPSWSHDGTRIVYSVGTGVYVINVDGSGNREIAMPYPLSISYPQW
jgi:Tol biopolymer transport system component